MSIVAGLAITQAEHCSKSIFECSMAFALSIAAQLNTRDESEQRFIASTSTKNANGTILQFFFLSFEIKQTEFTIERTVFN